MFWFQTRILVTHGITYLPKVDKIIVLDKGTISEVGTYNELISFDGAFAEFIRTYLNETSSESDPDSDGNNQSNVKRKFCFIQKKTNTMAVPFHRYF